MITCKDFVEFLMDYLEEGLPSPQRATFQHHLAACPPCQAYLDTYRKTIELGHDVCRAEEALPEDVPEALVRAILAARRSGGS